MNDSNICPDCGEPTDYGPGPNCSGVRTTMDLLSEISNLEDDNAQIAVDYQDLGNEMCDALERREELLDFLLDALRKTARCNWWDHNEDRHRYCWCRDTEVCRRDPECRQADDTLRYVYRQLQIMRGINGLSDTSN